MFNIFEKFASKTDDSALSRKEQEAQEKADRIKFHRTQVRNGPVKMGGPSNGQLRRRRVRAEKTAVRKNYRRDVRNYLEKQSLAATVRGHLQLAGVIPFIDGHDASVHQQVTSTAWLVQRFGTEIEIDGIGTGRVSFRKADVVDALINAAKFYNSATGAGLKFPANFEPAFSVVEHGGDIVEGATA